ncbi:phosphorylase family protein [Nitrosomonas cryotolerans]|uniref:phosphorylase family protein n=1 Tax=Nitrosomonas cryotolerans TaxID=44575 RepID=UPI00048CA579|nr:phosphorylase [Nitrosomonas cryotolerans]
MSVVGIVIALRAEANCLTSTRLPYNEIACLGNDTLVWLCGMGDHAARTAAKGLQANGATALISFGVAGALDSSLRSGDLVLPGAIHTSEKVYPVALDWRDRLQLLLPSHLSIANGILATSLVTLTSEAAKRELATATGACAVDMESGAIAETAANADIPFLAIRAIIDSIEFSPPPALNHAVYPDGSVNLFDLLKLLWRRSVNLHTLFQLAIGMRAACHTLSTVARYTHMQLGRTADK